MTYETSFTRASFYDKSLRGETIIPLGFDRRELRVVTRKEGNRGLSSSAQVTQASEDGRSYSYVLFGDFSKQLAHDPKARATEKNIRAQHAQALVGVDALIDEAKAFYSKKETA